MKFNGIVFPTAEHAYQYERAKFLNELTAANDILRVRKPQDAKLIGSRLQRSAQWDACKRDKMRDIVTAKFSQTPAMKAALINTGSINLIEATFDRFWGSGLPLNTKGMIEGRWHGSNVLGQILVELRTELRRETNHGKETHINVPQPSAGYQQPADLSAGTLSQTPCPPAPQTYSSAVTQTQSHSQQHLSQVLAGSKTRANGNQTNSISVVRRRSPSVNAQYTSNYFHPPPHTQYGQFSLPPPWSNFPIPYPPIYQPNQAIQMQPIPPPFISAGLPLIQSSPSSDSSGFVQGARHLSYDGNQSPIYC